MCTSISRYLTFTKLLLHLLRFDVKINLSTLLKFLGLYIACSNVGIVSPVLAAIKIIIQSGITCSSRKIAIKFMLDKKTDFFFN